MRIPDTAKSLDAQDLTITHPSKIVQQISDASKSIAINTQCSLQENGVYTERNSAMLEEVEQEMF